MAEQAGTTGEGGAGLAVRSALAWNLANQIVSQLVSAGVFLFLATRLDPVAFGLFAMALLLIEAFATEAKTALVDVLLMRRDFSPTMLSSAFWTAAVAAMLAYAALLVGAPAVGAALGLAGFGAIVAVLGLSILMAPPLAILESLMLRDLRFGGLAARNMAASLVSAAITLAFVAFGPIEWALVVQRLSSLAVGLAFLAARTPWRPTLGLDPARCRQLLRPFARVWLSQMVTFGLGRIVDLVIGLRLGAGPLGVYRVCLRLVEMVQASVTAPLTGVFIPVLTSHAAEPAHQREHYVQFIALAALFAAPTMTGLALVAPDLASMFLDPRYAGAPQLIALLATAGLVIPFAYFRSVALIGVGRPGLAAILAVLDLFATGLLTWIGAEHGLVGATAGGLAASGLAAMLATAVVSRVMGVGAVGLAAICAPAYGAAAAMALSVLAVALAVGSWPAGLRLALSVVTGAAVFSGYLGLLHRRWLHARVCYLKGNSSVVQAVNHRGNSQ